MGHLGYESFQTMHLHWY